MIVMELCVGGSLLDHLCKHKPKTTSADGDRSERRSKLISAGERIKYGVDITEGMKFIHEK